MKNYTKKCYSLPKQIVQALEEKAKEKKIKKSKILTQALCDYLGVVIE